jgi:hypothetical protein
MSTPEVIDLTPEELDLVLYAGDGVRLPLAVTDSAANPVDLTGTMRAQIRANYAALEPIATFAVDLSDAVNGNAVLTLDGADTQALVTSGKKFKGVWDVEWTPAGAQPRTLLQGKVECDPDATR